jgi:hypothetical protein
MVDRKNTEDSGVERWLAMAAMAGAMLTRGK